MIQTTATEFKANLGKYLVLAGREDIHITKNGMDVAVLTAPKAKSSWIRDLTSVPPDFSMSDLGLDSGMDDKQIITEWLVQKYESLD